MESPFFEQQISHIDHYGNLKEELHNALANANKRSEDTHYQNFY